jgi:hypothetical protein
MSTTVARLSSIQKALSEQGIAKDQDMQNKYKYRGIDQLMNALAPILAAHETVILSDLVEHRIENLQKGVRHIVKVNFHVVSPDGTLGPFASGGECIDFGDKGLNKAIGAAFKYWVFTSLCVPTESTADADSTAPEATEQVLGESEVKQVLDMLSKTDTDTNQYLEYLGYGSVNEIPMNKFAGVMSQLRRKAEKMAKRLCRG